MMPIPSILRCATSMLFLLGQAWCSMGSLWDHLSTSSGNESSEMCWAFFCIHYFHPMSDRQVAEYLEHADEKGTLKSNARGKPSLHKSYHWQPPFLWRTSGKLETHVCEGLCYLLLCATVSKIPIPFTNKDNFHFSTGPVVSFHW